MGKRKRRENPVGSSSSSPGHNNSGKRFRPAHVPGDVWWYIFILLPASSLARVRAVCKAWRTVIEDPIFQRAHHEKRQNNTMLIRTRTSSTAPPFALHYSVDLDDLIPLDGLQTIPATPARPHLRRFPVATCHGLMFEEFEIWNPLFPDRLKLPPLGGLTVPVVAAVRGLGYDHATDDYKAVLIDCGPRYRPRHQLQLAFRTFVYSLRSDSWRRVGDCPCGLRGPEDRPGIFLNGALHWMSCDDYYYDDDVDGDEIIALDLQTEKYGKLQMPPFGKVRRRKGRQLDMLDGCLVVTDFGMDGDCSFYFDVWVLERGGEWIKLFSLLHSSYGQIGSGMRPVGYIMKKKRHILMEDHGSFYLVDAERGKLKRVCFSGLDVDYLYAQPFQESLFRLKDICGGQQRNKMERKSKSKTRMVEKYDTHFCVCISDF